MNTANIVGVIKGVNLLATGVFELIPQHPFPVSEALFFPQESYAILRGKAGPAVTTTARIRVGGNVTHDDVMPLYVVPAGATVDAPAAPPLVARPYVPPNLRAGAFSFEVERAAIGPTTLIGDIMVIGILVSG